MSIQQQSYTLRPTRGEESLEDNEFTVEWSAGFEGWVIAWCRENHMDGAHVFAGEHGAIMGEGDREENYCGWIDARNSTWFHARPVEEPEGQQLTPSTPPYDPRDDHPKF